MESERVTLAEILQASGLIEKREDGKKEDQQKGKS